MWIINTNPEKHPTETLRHPKHTNGEVVEFTDNWTANVDEHVAKRMIRGYNHFEAKNDEDESETETES